MGREGRDYWEAQLSHNYNPTQRKGKTGNG